MATEMKKPVRLEINNSGAWKMLGSFDAADDVTWDRVFEHASMLFKTLQLRNMRYPHRPLMRVSMDTTGDTTTNVLAEWTCDDGWRDPVTGDAL